MAERFELFRLSLLPRPYRDIFAGPDVTRETYIRMVFSEEIIYKYNDEHYHYVPIAESAGQSIIAGRLGKRLTIEENRPPSEGLAETTRESWKASRIVIDPSEHADGQKVAVESNRSVASPANILLGLVRQINRTHPESIYSIEAAPIIETESFWVFAERNKGRITKIRFDFVAPNMFGGSDSITEELRDFKQKEKAHRISIELQNKHGLDVETEKTREAVDYVGKSGGTITAKAKRGSNYTSTDKTRFGSIPEPDFGGESAIDRIARFAKQILGRD